MKKLLVVFILFPVFVFSQTKTISGTVNDENNAIRINRLALLQMLCATFNNYFNFSKIDNG